jgi:phage terminase large subunit-like protein
MPRKKPVKNQYDAFRIVTDGLRQSVRLPNIHAYTPHEKQIEFHASTSPGRQFIGGNRSGKTTGGAAEAVMYLRGEHPYREVKWEPPIRGRCVTVDVEQGIKKIVLPQIKQFVPPSDLINGSWEDSWDAQGKTLTLENGSFIEFLTYEQDLEKFAGTSRHFVWFDEEPPKAIYTECMLRLLDTNGDWWMTMTPVDGLTWTFEEIYEKSAHDPYIFVVEVDTDDNPHIGEEEKHRIFSGLSEEDIEARKRGHYISLGGLIYPEFNSSLHIIKPMAPPRGWLRFNSMDSGFTNPTAWLFCCVDKEGRVVVFDEHVETNRIVAYHASKVLERDLFWSSPAAYNVGDPSIRNSDPITGTSVQLEYAENGVYIIPGNNDVRAGIDRIKRKLIGAGNGPQLYITENCRYTIWEWKRYRWKTYRQKQLNYEKNRPEEPHKKDDHAMDALRYAIASRPERDDGQVIPRSPSLEGVPEAVEIDKPFIDKEVVSLGQRSYRDYHLGEDY